MTPDIVVRSARPAEVDRLASLLAEAFLTNPVASWLISDVSSRYVTFLRVFGVELEHALAHGFVQVAGDCEGVAVWQPYPLALEAVTEHERRLLGAAGVHWPRFADLRAARDEHRTAALRLPTPGLDRSADRHPVGQELVYLAAAPWLRRRSIGAALLDDRHRVLDAAGIVGHAVTDEEYVRDLLVRRGYRTPGPRHLSPAGPALWSLRRDPASSGSPQPGSSGSPTARVRAGGGR
ncbi:hypothetical protein O7632_17685 [Solwaraspora sp. WMMD406]|uniref:hypothetical protein n=1 Tax=Solwaraspora sp. WMMD406 TaxID=3016095 RepID=UPI0024175BA2|nr:hypothetical protein [Solwaraspora sp. WMMD406]MDG4765916.1 hypothetical protein [Solwaraspora sp. WMMD406]